MGWFIPGVHPGQLPTWDVTWSRCRGCPAPVIPGEEHKCLTWMAPAVAADRGRKGND